MADSPRFLRRTGRVWIAPGLLLLISLAIPATRELHLLLLRMYQDRECREDVDAGYSG